MRSPFDGPKRHGPSGHRPPGKIIQVSAIPDSASLTPGLPSLISGAKILGLPVLATEQYPKGLGPTHPRIEGEAEKPLEKMDFSCAALGAVSGFL